MLEQLALHHDKWLRMARFIMYTLTQGSGFYVAGDLVGEMYIKLYKCDKEVNDTYVFLTLKSIYIDWLRAENKTSKLHDYLQYAGMMEYENFELPEEAEPVIELPDCLTWVEKQILLLRQTKSGRDIEKQYHINYQKVHRIENRAKEKLTAWVKKSEAQAMSLQQ